MRTVKQTASFRCDVKREAKGRYRGSLEEILMPVLTDLASDISLEDRYCDHALTGNKKGFRDCHIKPDLVLLYQKSDENTLFLVRPASHAELNL